MPREVPSAPSLPPLGPRAPRAPGFSSPAAEADDFDAELFALPDPPRGRRRLSLVILGIAAFAALAMVVALRRDVAYALVRSAPIDLGDLSEVRDVADVADV
ncbi:MAG: hypothetical protein JOZ69_17315, partial [Myxococcales bacterium]|nr:hypothetical protein [Myxococcales bacterium]